MVSKLNSNSETYSESGIEAENIPITISETYSKQERKFKRLIERIMYWK
jgi:hypothetical protein